jgi:lipopolysaccharide/colanic/teichoic acid biosynthesis glycosyltransferase
MVGAFVYRLFIILLCVIAAPVAIIIVIAVAVFSGMPILFFQKRVGKNGKIFTMYKFRTMRAGADTQQSKLRTKNEADGPAFKIRNDPRFTSIGRWLSHAGLDELPQLFNVLMGDMALIGPRPLPVYEAEKLKPWQQKRHSIKPGIISPWILDGYHDKTFNEWMKSDLAYAQTKSFWGDVRIFIRSVRFMCYLIIRATHEN